MVAELSFFLFLWCHLMAATGNAVFKASHVIAETGSADEPPGTARIAQSEEMAVHRGVRCQEEVRNTLSEQLEKEPLDK